MNITAIFSRLKTKKIFLKIITIGVILLAGYVIIWYLNFSKVVIKAAEKKELIWQIETAVLEQGSYTPHQKLYGQVNLERIIKINSPGNAEVEKVNVVSGSIVKKGDTLVVLSRQDFISFVNKAESKVIQTQLDIQKTANNIAYFQNLIELEQKLFSLNEKNLVRIRSLAKRKNASVQDLERAEETFLNRQSSLINKKKNREDSVIFKRQLEARLIAEQSELADAKLSLQRSTRKAKSLALVTRVSIQEGSQVTLNSSMIELLPLDNIEIKAVLIDKQLPEIINSLQGEKRLTANIDALGVTVSSQLVRLEGESKSVGQIGIFKLNSTSSEIFARIRPNLTLPINLILPPVDNSFAVPYNSIYNGEQLYTVDDDSRLNSVVVQILGFVSSERNTQKSVIVKSDQLLDGQIILTTNLPNATHGLKVKSNVQ